MDKEVYVDPGGEDDEDDANWVDEFSEMDETVALG